MPAEIRYSRVDRHIAMASDQAPRKPSLVRQLTALNNLPTFHPFMFHLYRTASFKILDSLGLAYIPRPMTNISVKRLMEIVLSWIKSESYS